MFLLCYVMTRRLKSDGFIYPLCYKYKGGFSYGMKHWFRKRRATLENGCPVAILLYTFYLWLSLVTLCKYFSSYDLFTLKCFLVMRIPILFSLATSYASAQFVNLESYIPQSILCWVWHSLFIDECLDECLTACL